jgi:hypothetical protein
MNLTNIKQPFTEIFPGDFSGNPMQRMTPSVVLDSCSSQFKNPELIVFNEKLSKNWIRQL